MTDTALGMRFGGKQRSLANIVMLACALAVIAVVPAALGGNRAIIWALVAAILAALLSLQAAYLLLTGGSMKLAPKALAPLAVPYLAFIAFAVVQVIPGAGIQLTQSASALGADPDWSKISLAPADSLFGILRWLSYGMLFFIIVGASAYTSRTQTALGAVFWIIFVHAGYALIALHVLGDPILFMNKWAYIGDATGGFVNRNSFATFLAIGSVIGVSRLLGGHRKTHNDRQAGNVPGKILNLTGLIVIVVALVSTNSRMGFVAGLVGMATSAALCLIYNARPAIWKAVVLVAFGTTLVIMSLILFGSSLGERFLWTEQALGDRTDLYRQVLSIIMLRPFSGYGLDSFPDIYPHFQAAPVALDMVWDRAHSTYLELWSDMGLIAGSLPMVMIGMIGAKIAGVLRHTRRQDPVLVSAAGAIVVAMLHSTTDFSLEMAGVGYLFVGLLALATARILTLRGGQW